MVWMHAGYMFRVLETVSYLSSVSYSLIPPSGSHSRRVYEGNLGV